MGSGLWVRKLNIHAKDNIFYKEYALLRSLSSLYPLVGEFSFLERGGLYVGWGEDNQSIRAMYGANSKPFIMELGSLKRHEREE